MDNNKNNAHNVTKTKQQYSYKWPAIIAGLATLVSLGAYIANFHNAPISKETANWAHFSDYIAGTAGTGLLLGTLIALFITITQQKKLIEIQESGYSDAAKNNNAVIASQILPKIIATYENRTKDIAIDSEILDKNFNDLILMMGNITHKVMDYRYESIAILKISMEISESNDALKIYTYQEINKSRIKLALAIAVTVASTSAPTEEEKGFLYFLLNSPHENILHKLAKIIAIYKIGFSGKSNPSKEEQFLEVYSSQEMLSAIMREKYNLQNIN